MTLGDWLPGVGFSVREVPGFGPAGCEDVPRLDSIPTNPTRSPRISFVSQPRHADVPILPSGSGDKQRRPNVEPAPIRDLMLRDVMRLAHERHYHGEGDVWGWMSHDRQKALENGEDVNVLRSEEFCRRYWSQVTTGDETAVWAQHLEALRTAPDPLLYCYENMP